MSSQPIHPGVPCPVCGAEPPYRIWSQFTYRNAVGEGAVNIRSPKHKVVGSEPIPLVCTVCGYVQLFINPQDFRD